MAQGAGISSWDKQGFCYPPRMSSPAALPPGKTMSPGLVVLLLALLLGIQPVTTDLYLPAHPPHTRRQGSDVAAGHLTQ